jgi:general secretion pathway protein D
LNRLVPAHANRVVLLAAFCVATALDASAQIQMPSQPTAPSPVASAPVAATPAMPPTLASGQQLLSNVQSALARSDYHTAVQSYRQAAVITAAVPQLAGALAKTRLQLEGIGIDSALLAMPPQATESTTMQRLPDVANALPINTSNLDAAGRKAEALRLVAIGRAALDRGDVSAALSIAKQAESLKVPEQNFAPGEPRVWDLLLDAESAARRSGIALASGTSPATPAPGAVQAALAKSPKDEVGVIAQMLYNADADAGQSTAGDIQQVQNVESLPPGEMSYGQRTYYDGLDALRQGDTEMARTRFVEAWKYESELSVTERNQLKDKLTLLQPKRLAPQPDESGELSPIQKAELESQDKTRRLLREVTGELAKTQEIKESAPLDALDALERLRRTVDESEIDEQAKRSIAGMVDNSIRDQKKYIEANRAKIDLDLQNQSIRMEMSAEQELAAQTDEEVSALVSKFNQLMDDRRYPEAEVIAKQVQELVPEHSVATQMLVMSRAATRKMMAEEVKYQKELSWLDNLHDVDVAAISPNPNLPMQYQEGETWESLSRLRLESRNNREVRLSLQEQEIKKKLPQPVSVKYENRPLSAVLDELQTMTGVPIHVDERALAQVRVTSETPVSIAHENLPLKSVLTLMLDQLELTYVIENDVLMITTQQSKQAKVYPETYRVTDLVTPIPNFTSSYEDGLAGALRAAYQMTRPQADVYVTPVSSVDLRNGAMASAMSPNSNPNVLGQYNPMGAQNGFGLNNPPTGGGAGGGSFADFQSLMDLIQTTVVPETWEALGGPSTMAPYPQNLSLVIATTSDVHDQIADLLESLRRLQNLQITIEVRFITLSDTFAEQIGVDFNVEFKDNLTRLPQEDDRGVVVGFDGLGGLPTPDLDIRFDNGSFGLNPPFGAAGLGTPSTLGFAILSDIEAFFFLQAAQSDNRTNVMQAPKVTMFDGQFASISDQTQRPFVTSIIPVVGDFAVAQQPVIVVLNEGTQLNVQGIVSDDKRFVRLTLVPFFSQIGDVDTFTYEGRRTTRNSSRDEEGDTNDDGVVDDEDAVDTEDSEDTTVGTTVQLPTFAFTSVSTTVSVPDGGTILLGGIKRLAEGRNERGVPVLSKIPYVSRLFRNVSAGREARSLMLMVTPRIIIQEEEELAQTGFRADSN